MALQSGCARRAGADRSLSHPAVARVAGAVPLGRAYRRAAAGIRWPATQMTHRLAADGSSSELLRTRCYAAARLVVAVADGTRAAEAFFLEVIKLKTSNTKAPKTAKVATASPIAA